MAIDDDKLTIEDIEIITSIYHLATLASLFANKKVAFQNLFLQILDDAQFNKIAKEMLECQSDIEICRNLLIIDPNLVKSKLILSYIKNKNKA